jgi:hypothetical protein
VVGVGLLLASLGLLVAGVLVLALLRRRGGRVAVAQLYVGNPDAFLAWFDAQPWWARLGWHADVVPLNRAVGWFWKGDFARALALLEGIDGERLRGPARMSYDSSLISSLIMLHRLTEAEQVYEQRSASLRACRHPLSRMVCDTLEADLAFWGHDEQDTARRLNEGLLRLEVLPPIARASIDWTLAEIAHRQGDDDRALGHLDTAARRAGTTFVTDKVASLRAAILRRRESQLRPGPSDEVADPDTFDPVAVPLDGSR